MPCGILFPLQFFISVMALKNLTRTSSHRHYANTNIDSRLILNGLLFLPLSAEPLSLGRRHQTWIFYIALGHVWNNVVGKVFPFSLTMELQVDSKLILKLSVIKYIVISLRYPREKNYTDRYNESKSSLSERAMHRGYMIWHYKSIRS